MAKSPVLSGLEVEIAAARGFFHFSRIYPGADRAFAFARALPLAGTGDLLLEAQSSRGTYFEVAVGKPATVVRALAIDTTGTFHGLGAIELRARKTKSGLGRERMRRTASGFEYVADRAQASVQEILFHHFGLPLHVVAEPGDWYAYHRRPQIVEHSADRVLVGFTAVSLSGGRFGGTCLYARRDAEWSAYKIKPSASESVAKAEAWLVKRSWEEWS
ncbi:MAG: hypothetical protein HYV09_26845 [Deltaproteobacteria bacterium]|nr:hypothetical protein [Deltaproteobacteria bacterium]